VAVVAGALVGSAMSDAAVAGRPALAEVTAAAEGVAAIGLDVGNGVDADGIVDADDGAAAGADMP
jgi:hypothetical protein